MYHKTYPNTCSEIRHKQVYLNNLKLIDEHNAGLNDQSFALKPNSFSDLVSIIIRAYFSYFISNRIPLF